MRSPVLLALAAAAALAAGSGCVDTDPNIFVSVELLDPTVGVENAALGTAVTGGFLLDLHLGARAADGTTVNVQGFELISEDQNTIIVPSLPLSANGHTLPIVVEPGTDESVEIVIDLGDDLLAKEVGQNLCNFGSVRYRGSITDSLRGTTVPVLTDPVQVTGCAPQP
ncbi:MAG: hypothetical protein R3B70_36985 [Polyangiaceae bacterium]